MRYAIVGSRDYPNLEEVAAFIESLPKDAIVVSGKARGVDSKAAHSAAAHHLQVVEYLPDWEKYGRAAGYIRNQDIVADTDVVVAFWDGQSRGTAHTMQIALNAGKLVFVKTPYTAGFIQL